MLSKDSAGRFQFYRLKNSPIAMLFSVKGRMTAGLPISTSPFRSWQVRMTRDII
jgi:hypothetical protein